jgi:hypothetical protein
MNETFIRLISALASCGTNEPGNDEHARWTETLKAIYRLNHPPAHSFLASINLSGLPNEAAAELLLRCHRMAKAYLPELLRQYQAEKAKSDAETNHNKFLRQQVESDPFLGEDTQLTRDAYAGRGCAEEEQPAKLDAWGNVIQ